MPVTSPSRYLPIPAHPVDIQSPLVQITSAQDPKQGELGKLGKFKKPMFARIELGAAHRLTITPLGALRCSTIEISARRTFVYLYLFVPY